MNGTKLKSGYTTGSCAAAATKAAVIRFLTGKLPETVTLKLPEGQFVMWSIMAGTGDFSEYSCVQKDAGDDPDVTHGVWVYAKVSDGSAERLSRAGVHEHGYQSERYPNLYLTGGTGIGVVTREGLSCPVYHYAINPVPRSMIFQAAAEVCREYLCKRPLLIELAIPEGVTLAQQTFNPRLGIAGGISILGTSGIVRPMSEEALLDTIRLDLHVRNLSEKNLVLMTPGNYGERFLTEEFGCKMGEAVVCSNFIADSMRMAAAEGVQRLIFVGHIGKLIKIAAGMENTHSKYGDHRMETIAQLVLELVPEYPRLKELLAMNTTEEAMEHLKQQTSGPGKTSLAEDVMKAAAEKVRAQLLLWCQAEIEIQVIVFASKPKLVAMTEGAEALIGLWKGML